MGTFSTWDPCPGVQFSASPLNFDAHAARIPLYDGYDSARNFSLIIRRDGLRVSVSHYLTKNLICIDIPYRVYQRWRVR